MEPVAATSQKLESAGTSWDFKAPQFGKHSKRLASTQAGCVPCSSRKQIRRRGTHNKWEPMNGSRKAATLIDQRDSPYDTSERKRGARGERGRYSYEIWDSMSIHSNKKFPRSCRCLPAWTLRCNFEYCLPRGSCNASACIVLLTFCEFPANY